MFLDDGKKVTEIPAGQKLVVPAQEQAQFRVLESSDESSALATNVVVVRQGEDLVMNFADGTVVVIENYFQVCAAGACEVILPKHGEAKGKVLEEDAKGTGQKLTGDAKVLVIEGTPLEALEAVKADPELTQVVSEILAGGPQSALAPEAAPAGGFPWVGFWSVLGVIGAGVAYDQSQDDDGGPAILFNPTGSTAPETVSVAESAPTTTVIYDANATFNGGTADANLTYTLSGADAAAFTIDAAGVVTLVASADFETQASYNFNVVATSMDGQTAEQVVQVTVIDQPLLVNGVILAGPVVAGHGLVIEAFDPSGNSLGTGTVNPDGTFSIAISDNYTGPIILRVSDSTPGADFAHEGSGANEDLTVDLRAVGAITGDGTVTINVNPLTEIAARELLGDQGGDNGSAAVTSLGLTDAQVEAANRAVATAFGLPDGVDLVGQTPVAVNDSDFAAADANAQAIGRVAAALAAAELTQGASSQRIIQGFVDGLNNSVLDQSQIAILQSGAAFADNVQGNASGTVAATQPPQSGPAAPNAGEGSEQSGGDGNAA